MPASAKAVSPSAREVQVEPWWRLTEGQAHAQSLLSRFTARAMCRFARRIRLFRLFAPVTPEDARRQSGTKGRGGKRPHCCPAPALLHPLRALWEHILRTSISSRLLPRNAHRRCLTPPPPPIFPTLLDMHTVSNDDQGGCLVAGSRRVSKRYINHLPPTLWSFSFPPSIRTFSLQPRSLIYSILATSDLLRLTIPSGSPHTRCLTQHEACSRSRPRVSVVRCTQEMAFL